MRPGLSVRAIYVRSTLATLIAAKVERAHSHQFAASLNSAARAKSHLAYAHFAQLTTTDVHRRTLPFVHHVLHQMMFVAAYAADVVPVEATNGVANADSENSMSPRRIAFKSP